MNQKIQAALAKLDPANDNHWTQDGLPRLDTIRILVSDPTLTRSQVTLAAPDFNRGRVEAVGATAVQAATVAADEGVTDTPNLAGVPMVEKSFESERRRAAELQLQLSDAMRRAAEAEEEVMRIQNEIGELHEKFNAVRDNPAETIQKYLKQQRENLLVKAEQQRSLLESGLDLKAIAAGFKEPIDSVKSVKTKYR